TCWGFGRVPFGSATPTGAPAAAWRPRSRPGGTRGHWPRTTRGRRAAGRPAHTRQGSGRSPGGPHVAGVDVLEQPRLVRPIAGGVVHVVEPLTVPAAVPPPRLRDQPGG